MSKWKREVDAVLALENDMMQLSDEQLRAKTDEFKERLEKGESLDSLLVEAYAVVREAANRVLHMKHFPVQIEGGIALHKGNIAEMRTGEGKAVPLSTPMPTPNGWKTAGDIKVGDMLFDRHGKPTKVIGVYPQGEKEVYQVTLKDGRTVKCADEHLWEVYDGYNATETTTKNTKELLETHEDINRGFRYHLPTSEAVEYDEKVLPLDPYVMGAFLGNGSKNKPGNFVFSSDDEEVVTEIKNLLHADETHRNVQNYDWTFKKDGSRIKVKDVSPELEGLLTDTYSYEKYIPEEYKTASVEQRWALIQGMMDTDGNIYEEADKKRYNIQYSTTSPRLRDDFMEVLYSLGCSCRYCFNKKAGQGNAVHDQYQIKIHVPNEIKERFFRLKRKKNLAVKAKGYVKSKDYSRIAITKIEKLPEKTEQVCFEVENEEHLFLAGNYVVTHNTLVSTMPAYLNALEGKGVHVVTVNDYLAKRDAEWMGAIHRFLGLSVDCILSDDKPPRRKEAYSADITYITNNELGFDYLRDNMADSTDECVQRGLHYCIIDEVDSILIDEARTPLIISGGGSESTKLYLACDVLAKQMTKCSTEGKLTQENIIEGVGLLEDGDFFLSEKEKSVSLTGPGVDKIEHFFGIENLSDPTNLSIQRGMILALRANNLMHKDKDYIVKNGEVLIVDEFTGRIMDGRRFSDGLHQAIEAKEGVEVNGEDATLATVTFQNFFNKYDKKCGMTGTAKTEAKEFRKIYHMGTVVIPTNKPVIRVDEPDSLYITMKEKYNAIVKDVIKTHETGQPVLIGTTSIETSETLSKYFKKAGIKHVVLNAKFHEKEAEIVSHAGEKGAVTIATNMAGRGTDIILEDGVAELGGLRVIGSERHESRRIDNQLIGRSGRQGDPGSSKFYLSLEDNLLRLFGSERMIKIYKAMGFEENEEISDRRMEKTIRKAQKRIEANNFNTRKNLLDYDKANNEQRELIYHERGRILANEDMREVTIGVLEDAAREAVQYGTVKKKNGKYDVDPEFIGHFFPTEAEGYQLNDLSKNEVKELENSIVARVLVDYQKVENSIPEESIRAVERSLLLQVIDRHWMLQIDDMERLKNSIHLQSYAGKEPASQYKLEGYKMFEEMLANIRHETACNLLRIRAVNA